MDLDFTSEQDMLRDFVAKFLAQECPYDRVKELEESDEGYSAELWQQMAELGWLGLTFPEDCGGSDGSFTDLAIIQEEMGYAAFPSPFVSTVIQCGSILLEGGSEEQKQALLPEIAEGKLIMALAQYEQEGSYLEAGIKMKAEAAGEGYRLNGVKMFVLDANVAGQLIVAAQAAEGTTLFLVDASDPGIAVTKMPTIALDNTCEVIFTNVSVAKKDIIGAPGGGWELLEKMLAKAAVAKAAEMVGGCRACLGMTTEYAKERAQYGKPIGGYQAIQHYMANMLLAYDTARSYLYQVSWAIDEGEASAADVSVMKACINENFNYVSERSVQIHGGIGTSREHSIGLFYRRAKAYEFACGDTGYHNERIIEDLLAHGVAR